LSLNSEITTDDNKIKPTVSETNKVGENGVNCSKLMVLANL